MRELIEGRKLLFVDDSIVRGTQLQGTVDFLFETGAAEVHMRSACPPIMYPCKFLNFSRNNSDMDLLARRTVRELAGDAVGDALGGARLEARDEAAVDGVLDHRREVGRLPAVHQDGDEALHGLARGEGGAYGVVQLSHVAPPIPLPRPRRGPVP